MKKKRVPTDFIVSARIRELAQRNGWPDPDSERDAFVDHHTAKGSLFVDLEAAFRTWLRNAARWRSREEPVPTIEDKEVAKKVARELYARKN
jgi:hypothetical protein